MKHIAILLLGLVLSLAPNVYAGNNAGGNFSIWPDTGQTLCYDDDSEITCPADGELFNGQDSQYQGPTRSYTKLDANGNALPNNASDWVMVRDNVTGLIWEVKQNQDNTTDYNNPHDADNTYTWCDTNANTNGGNQGTCGDGTDTEDFINPLNSANFGGYSDWRIPTLKELVTLVDYSVTNGAVINLNMFPNTLWRPYWSSTTFLSAASGAWRVVFSGGNTSGYDTKSVNNYVRAVRGGSSPNTNRFTDNGDGTIIDTVTGLIWQKANADRDDDGIPDTMLWREALAYCENLSLGGHGDWRLPNISELRSIADYASHNPAVDTATFPDVLSSNYWSSTTISRSLNIAWKISFLYGGDGYGNKTEDNCYVRAVRGYSQNPDTDSDRLPDIVETECCMNISDADTDEDGLADGEEDANQNGVVDDGETDPCDIDTDDDGIQDGTELGVTDPVADPDDDGPLLGTDNTVFQPDLDPSTTTDPTKADTDGDGIPDGNEDTNHNGKVDEGETDPNNKSIGIFFPIKAKDGKVTVIFIK